MGGCGCYAPMTAIFHPSFTLSDEDGRAALEKEQTKMSVATLHSNKSGNKSLTVFTIFHVTRRKGLCYYIIYLRATIDASKEFGMNV